VVYDEWYLLDALATRFEGQITMRLLVPSATGRKPSKHLYDCTQSHREIISAEMDTDHPKMMTIGLQESRQHTSEFSYWKAIDNAIPMWRYS
jgi:hypothetical protein